MTPPAMAVVFVLKTVCVGDEGAMEMDVLVVAEIEFANELAVPVAVAHGSVVCDVEALTDCASTALPSPRTYPSLLLQHCCAVSVLPQQ